MGIAEPLLVLGLLAACYVGACGAIERAVRRLEDFLDRRDPVRPYERLARRDRGRG